MKNRPHAPGFLLITLMMMIGCTASTSGFTPALEWQARQRIAPLYPKTAFAVFADPHLFDARLGTGGKAFTEYIRRDRKLLAESEALLDATVDQISGLDVDFVIVCGDLTKDGERTNHLLAAEKLRRLVDGGKPVFVVPGNHDIANNEAVRYVGDHNEPLPTISGEEFAQIYKDFGYGAALDRDPHSLSYIAEPVEGLWLLALDSCRWHEQGSRGRPITGGAISDATRTWIEDVLRRAKLAHKAVIAMGHHGVLEHYPHNARFYGSYLVDDHRNVAAMLSVYGVELVFTGHFHAQDVTAKHFEDPPRTLYDIETGSLVTAPNPYRIVRINPDQKALIESRFITAIAGHETGFQAYAADTVYQGTVVMADTALKKYRVGDAGRQRLAPQISRAYVTHLKGDEPPPAIVVNTEDLGLWAGLVTWLKADLISGWTTDLPPADNQLTIDLAADR